MPLFPARSTAALFLVSSLVAGALMGAETGKGTGERENTSDDDVRVVFSEIDGEIEVVIDDIDELEDDVRVIFYEANGQIHVMLRQ